MSSDGPEQPCVSLNTLGYDFLMLLELDEQQHHITDVLALRVVERLDVIGHIRASSRERQTLRLINSCFGRLKKLSAAALSRQLPRWLTE